MAVAWQIGVRAFQSSGISVLGQFTLVYGRGRARERSDLRARPRGTRTTARSVSGGPARSNSNIINPELHRQETELKLQTLIHCHEPPRRRPCAKSIVPC